ncbi:hypothetical protein HV213_31560 (plasmid) [Klebsiella sp. RHBSTW-00484]|uniref:hypothetical protein n=1 Tax=unclassified Klebsiella TaxID=2608929 RepID=UPI0015E4C2CF|nr:MULTISPECIES: hypothetical protein [unclassified Klebsiella]QLO40274.1 hypothetical protein HV213_31560 [Klebsiella sp. RHBSTW-00484]QLT79955.1 hypothetical protein HV204_32430 [Klebsiella sp. RHBSTW-00464]
MGSCAAPSAKGDDKFITTDYLQQCLLENAFYGDIKAWVTEIHTALTSLQLELRSQHLALTKELLNNEPA